MIFEAFSGSMLLILLNRMLVASNSSILFHFFFWGGFSFSGWVLCFLVIWVVNSKETERERVRESVRERELVCCLCFGFWFFLGFCCFLVAKKTKKKIAFKVVCLVFGIYGVSRVLKWWNKEAGKQFTTTTTTTTSSLWKTRRVSQHSKHFLSFAPQKFSLLIIKKEKEKSSTFYLGPL